MQLYPLFIPVTITPYFLAEKLNLGINFLGQISAGHVSIAVTNYYKLKAWFKATQLLCDNSGSFQSRMCRGGQLLPFEIKLHPVCRDSFPCMVLPAPKPGSQQLLGGRGSCGKGVIHHHHHLGVWNGRGRWIRMGAEEAFSAVPGE